MKYLLFNPLAGAGEAKSDAEGYSVLSAERCRLVDMTEISNYKEFLEILEDGDEVYIFGGDGSINRFINGIGETQLTNNIYYFPSGTHNNFALDIKNRTKPVLINHQIKRLPYAFINGKKYMFVSGINIGLDNCCLELEKEQKKEGQVKNYYSNAFKAVFSAFKPFGVTLSVDNRRTHIKKVWISDITFGTHCGSGMIPAPRQKRGSSDRKVSLSLLHSTGKLKTLMVLPSVFKGKHLKYKKNVTVLSGNRIDLDFEKEISVRIDGEVIDRVKDISVTVR